jgi:hypothetical protein
MVVEQVMLFDHGVWANCSHLEGLYGPQEENLVETKE